MRARLDRLAGNAGFVFRSAARDRIRADDIADGVLRAPDRLPERAAPTAFSSGLASSIIVATGRFADRRAGRGAMGRTPQLRMPPMQPGSVRLTDADIGHARQTAGRRLRRSPSACRASSAGVARATAFDAAVRRGGHAASRCG
jgi:hypothetical protein